MKLLLIAKHKWKNTPYLRVQPKAEFVLLVAFDPDEEGQTKTITYENFKTTRTPAWLRHNRTAMQSAEVAAQEANEIVAKLSALTDASQYKDGELIWSKDLPPEWKWPNRNSLKGDCHAQTKTRAHRARHSQG